MKKTILTILQYILFLGLGIWIIYQMLHQLKPDEKTELVNAMTSVKVQYLIPIFFIGFLSHFFRAVRWRYLLETVELKPTLTNTTFAVLIGYIANLALPRAGEVAKCTVLARYEKMPAHKMIGTIVAERAFDLVTLVVIAILAFTLQMQFVSDYVSSLTRELQTKFEHIKMVLITLVIVGVLSVPLAIFLYRKHKDSKIGKFITGLLHGIMSIVHMKKRWQFLGFTLLIWLMYLLQLYIGFWCIPETAHLSLAVALVTLVWGSVGMILPAPGGIGIYTLLVAQMLTAYGVDKVHAQAFGWVAWVAQNAVVIILGLTSLLAIHSYNRKRNGQTAVGTA